MCVPLLLHLLSQSKVICTGHYLKEYCAWAEDLDKCWTFAGEANHMSRSLLQRQGLICRYYMANDCSKSFLFELDTVAGPLVKQKLEDMEYKIAGVKSQKPGQIASGSDEVEDVDELFPRFDTLPTEANSENSSPLPRDYPYPAGFVVVCPLLNYGGGCEAINAAEKCSPSLVNRTISSIIQSRGAICTYYKETDCQAGNHSPSWRVDSRPGTFMRPDMEDWKIASFECKYNMEE
jgi:hypothetical protein